MTPHRPTLIVLSGYSGSGKTTKAKELCKAHNAYHLQSDDFHHFYRPGMDVTGLLIALAKSLLMANIDVVVDAVNKHPDDAIRWTFMADSYSVNLGLIDMYVPIEECIRRDALRPNPVGRDAILKQAEG